MATKATGSGEASASPSEHPKARKFVPEVDVDYSDDLDEVVDNWDGTVTELELLFPVLRGEKGVHRTVGRGQKIYVEASQDKAGNWHGPEAVHVQDLINGGFIAGTVKGNERIARHAAIDYQRGLDNPDTKERLADLRQPATARQLRQAMGPVVMRDLEGNVSELRRREGVESGNTVKELIEALTGNRDRQFAGAAAPGSAQNRDGTPLVKE